MAAPKPIALISKHSKRSKFSYLFATLISLIVLFPYLAQPGLSTVIFRLLSALAFVAAVYAVSDKRTQWITGLLLAIPTAVLNTWLAFHPSSSSLEVPSLVSTLIFLGFTLVTLLRAVLSTETVTRDTIYGALSVYLLMAFVWGIAYLLLETLQPGGLSMDITRHPNHKVDWFDCMFYSFVTLTSLGYGDMVPISAQCRSLSVLEAVSGIMYVAVLVARLVGLYAARKSEVQ
ncbi:MAG TPA: ion channel [Terriglobales bacterium]|nr:ion channel [Terriglobales bacterium]